MRLTRKVLNPSIDAFASPAESLPWQKVIWPLAPFIELGSMTFAPSVEPASDELPPLLAPAPGARDDFLTVNYLGGPLSSADGYAMPALAVLDGLCPTVVINAEYDDLRASGEAFTAVFGYATCGFRFR